MGHIQVGPGESLTHHPLATILIEELLHVLDELVELDLELILVLLRGIGCKHEVDCICS